MDPQDEYILSFYQEFGDLDSSHGVKLVRHTESGNIYVKKELKEYDLSVFRLLQGARFQGIPRIECLVEDKDSGKLIVIEEFINGQTLRTILNRKGTLPEDQAASVLTAICDVLEPLHDNEPPVIHRDIKPENIIITDDSELYIVDFDASKLYSEGKDRDTELIGTRRYAAPEQYGYSQSDPRTDIYAIGKVGREMITGDPVKTSGEPASRIAGVLDKCTSMDPDDRYENARELKYALASMLAPGARPERENDIRCQDAHLSDDTMSETARIHMTSWALPGFRTHTVWKTAAATAAYFFLAVSLIYYFIQNEAGYPMPKRLFYTTALGIMIFLWILLLGNYRGIASRLPLTRSRNILVKIIGFIIYATLILAAVAVVFSPVL